MSAAPRIEEPAPTRLLRVPLLRRVRLPRDLAAVTSIGEEATPREARVTRGAVDQVWRATEALYSTGVYPALQICVRRRGHVVLSRALGHARGNAPGDPADARKVPCTPDTPFTLYSASKAVTAMVIHKLDEMGKLHLEDRVADYVPEFAQHGKQWITIRHLLSHRAGIPNLPQAAFDLDRLQQPEKIVALINRERPSSRPGRLLAYHAVSGGFVLGAVARRAAGRGIERVLETEIARPLGFRWLRYGVKRRDVERVAQDAVTGPPAPFPLSWLIRRALGVGHERVVELANDPRFLTAVVPAGNVVANAEELSAFFQCLLDGGVLNGVRVFEERTVRHATAEQSYREIDLTLGIALRYGLGMMLGDRPLGIFGPDTPRAFGHLGFTNMFGWADPDRELAVAILTSGKPLLSLHALRLGQLLLALSRAFPRPRRRK